MFQNLSYTAYCHTVEGPYTDRLLKSYLNYCNASSGFDCMFVVFVLSIQMYVRTDHSIGGVIAQHTTTLKVRYVSFF